MSTLLSPSTSAIVSPCKLAPNCEKSTCLAHIVPIEFVFSNHSIAHIYKLVEWHASFSSTTRWRSSVCTSLSTSRYPRVPSILPRIVQGNGRLDVVPEPREEITTKNSSALSSSFREI